MRCPCLECPLREHDKRTLVCVLCEKRITFDDYIRAYYVVSPSVVDMERAKIPEGLFLEEPMI